MTVSGARASPAAQVQEAEIMRHRLPGWIIGVQGAGRPPLRDDGPLGCPMSFSSTEEARDHIHLVADCPVQVEHLYRFFER